MKPKNKSVPMLYINKKERVLCDSRAEALVGYEIQIAGYNFKHDEEYPYKENETHKRYDYLLVRKDGKEYPHRIFIEVKGDNESHFKDDLQPKQRMVDRNQDYLIAIEEKDIGSVYEEIEKTRRLMEKENPKKSDHIPLFYNKSILKDGKKA